MKKLLYALLFLILTPLLNKNLNGSPLLAGFDIEGKISAFFPSSKTVRKIFSVATPYYEVEIGQRFHEDWQVWLNAGYVNDSGHALGGCNSKTKVQFVPITLGLKYFYPIGYSSDIYAGAGLSWSFVRTKDYSPFVNKTSKNQGVGGLFKLGFINYIREQFFIDIFTEYLYQRFSFKRIHEDHYTLRNNLNMSGLKLGAGIGLYF